jgi:hypothetical protein
MEELRKRRDKKWKVFQNLLNKISQLEYATSSRLLLSEYLNAIQDYKNTICKILDLMSLLEEYDDNEAVEYKTKVNEAFNENFVLLTSKIALLDASISHFTRE